MKLELKHLAPYLPYQLRIFHSSFMPFRNNCNENEIGTMVGITDVLELDVLGETTFDIVMRRDKDFYKLHDSRGHFKPILKPLSDLPKNEFISELGRFSERYKFNIDQVSYLFIEKLFKKHFDVYGLIDAGLAIDINTLNK